MSPRTERTDEGETDDQRRDLRLSDDHASPPSANDDLRAEPLAQLVEPFHVLLQRMAQLDLDISLVWMEMQCIAPNGGEMEGLQVQPSTASLQDVPQEKSLENFKLPPPEQKTCVEAKTQRLLTMEESGLITTQQKNSFCVQI